MIHLRRGERKEWYSNKREREREEGGKREGEGERRGRKKKEGEGERRGREEEEIHVRRRKRGRGREKGSGRKIKRGRRREKGEEEGSKQHVCIPAGPQAFSVNYSTSFCPRSHHICGGRKERERESQNDKS